MYVATDGDGRTKIGFTTNAKTRMYHLSRKRGRPVTVFRAWEPDPRTEVIEGVVQWALRDRHLAGEWFSVTPEDACASIDEAFRTVQVGDAVPRRFATSKRFELVREAEQEIDRNLEPGESRVDFILRAVAAELSRRERAKPKD